MSGTWRAYYEKWRHVTRRELDPKMLDLVPALRRFTPPAPVFDKKVYSAFAAPGLLDDLRSRGTDALIITGAETDVCVLGTVLDAIDLGLRVVIVSDGVCSSSDEGHDALIRLFTRRFSEQAEVADAATVLEAWQP
jgi:nicotinamidase-related amidase